MSELKATTVYDAYWKANSVGDGNGIQVYLKSEADKEIEFWKRESHEHYERWFNLNMQYEGWFGKVMRCERAERELRHQKYKRCLAMAMWCKSKSEIYNEFAADAAEYMPSYEARFHRKAVLYQKWAMRWLELAEKFKEEK